MVNLEVVLASSSFTSVGFWYIYNRGRNREEV